MARRRHAAVDREQASSSSAHEMDASLRPASLFGSISLRMSGASMTPIRVFGLGGTPSSRYQRSHSDPPSRHHVRRLRAEGATTERELSLLDSRQGDASNRLRASLAALNSSRFRVSTRFENSWMAAPAALYDAVPGAQGRMKSNGLPGRSVPVRSGTVFTFFAAATYR